MQQTLDDETKGWPVFDVGERAYYRAYTLDTSEEQARELFEMRYGRSPDEVRKALGAVLAGPVPATAKGVNRMGPYCAFCGQRCFVPMPLATPLILARAHGGDVLATCPEGQRYEKETTGYCYDDIMAEIEKWKAFDPNTLSELTYEDCVTYEDCKE